MISASLGMAKALKVGPCRVLGDRGLLRGFLSHRFLLLFFACFFTLVGKAIFLVLVFTWVVENDIPIAIPILTFLASTLPGMINACFFCWHRGILKTFLDHPSFLLLPTFTCFTFKANGKFCPPDDVDGDEVELRFSSKATLFNILFTLGGMSTIALIMSQFFPPRCQANACPSSIFLFMTASPVFLLGLLLTGIFLCTTRSSSTCCTTCCCCCPCSPEVAFGVYKPAHPLEKFVLHYDTYGSKKIKMVLPVKDDDPEEED